ncbi:CBU_0592 family membrane protein [Anditalea andensis]|uniref:CBU-0592-like domain-containing protein n=1 Tax=Anditalea andensis TaxID=1048983 RepID=A0A074KUU5_9BACT|nr:hypothetical protein [Anditalea andensis]KEO73746.1 hypothetical protein EL17_09525 [Anditalea andensis]
MIAVRRYKLESIRKYKNEAIGWVGAMLSLLGFSLNSLNLVGSQSIEYLSLNIAGCFLLILYAVHKKAHASWVLNSIWILMTLVAFAKTYLPI